MASRTVTSGSGQAGGNGPDVTVRLAILRSPFYDKLFVAGIQVGLAPPFYVLQDASAVPPAWPEPPGSPENEKACAMQP